MIKNTSRFVFNPWIRTRIWIRVEADADPATDPHYKVRGSTSLIKMFLMNIYINLHCLVFFKYWFSLPLFSSKLVNLIHNLLFIYLSNTFFTVKDDAVVQSLKSLRAASNCLCISLASSRHPPGPDCPPPSGWRGCTSWSRSRAFQNYLLEEKNKNIFFNTAKKLWVIKGTDSVPKCFNSHFYSSHDSILYPYSSTVLTVSTAYRYRILPYDFDLAEILHVPKTWR